MKKNRFIYAVLRFYCCRNGDACDRMQMHKSSPQNSFSRSQPNSRKQMPSATKRWKIFGKG